MYCVYKFCPWAAENKAKKCGESSSREQAARAKSQLLCAHPLCNRPYHGLCHAIMHRLISRERVNV